jgi:hypothetical protein
MTKSFETRWITLLYRSTGDLSVTSDGIIDGGIRSIPDVDADLEKLCLSGWVLVCDMKHKHNNCGCPGRDLYFRRLVQTVDLAGSNT